MIEVAVLAGLVVVGAVLGVVRSRRGGDTNKMPNPFQR
jgi:hypothetical protein